MSEKKNTANNKHKSNALTIVGIGASAGGLNALKTFFKHVPEESGLAFVIVVHLSPDHESHLADLLQPHVNMPVQQVTQTMALEPNHVYVIPPGCNLNTIDTHLRLSDLEERRRERAPIDHFFRTLAKTHDGHAVGVILTGTGSDGTLGIKEIKGQGGLTIVQDPNEAEYDGMPQSALTTGMVDIALPLEKIPKYILRFANTEPQLVLPEEGEDLEENHRQLLQKIFTQIRSLTGRDFSRYKRSTIMRRIQRRMQIAQIEQLESYLDLLRDSPEEIKILSDEFLITVTSFFRDREVFEQLAQEIIPSLFEEKAPDESIRVWSVGCATGEEAYSLAMLLLEEAGQQEAPPELQVFASDLHEHSLQKARDGFYPGDIETDVSAERLKRFFVKEDGGYRIRKEVREMVVFAPHNLLADPPFSRIDLILCRNLLIYLQRDVQRDVIEIFHYALKPEGFLLLGTSETLESAELFHTENKMHCLFRKRNVQAPEPRLPVFPLTQSRLQAREETDTQKEDTPIAYGALHQRLVERYAPPSLLVSPDYKVVHLSEHVGRYLAHPGGEFTANIFKLVREEFRIELRAALHAAKENSASVHTKPIPFQVEGQSRWVVLSVFPAEDKLQKGFSVVIFDEQEKMLPPDAIVEATDDTLRHDTTVQQLQAELDRTKQQLQAVIEEYETSQEEMKASNEEMQSTNEELRSTLEELETSKEELQSMNEELTTLNQENRHKVEELSQLSGDLQNLLTATDIATLFLDRHFRILRFTPQVSDIFNIRMADRGRPLSDYTHRLGYDELLNDVKQVLNKLIPIEREVQDEEGRWYLTRVLPYRSTEDRIEGVVITFIDISKRIETEKSMRENEALYRALASHLPGGAVFVVNKELRYLLAEGEALTAGGAKPADFEGKTLTEALGKQAANKYEPLYRQALQGKPFQWEHKDQERYFISHGVPLRDASGKVYAALSVSYDLTKQKQTEEALRQSKERYQTLFKSMDERFCVIEMLYDDDNNPVDYRFIETNPAFEKHTGLVNAVGKTVLELVPGLEDHWIETYGKVAITGETERFIEESPKMERWFEVAASRIGGEESIRVGLLFTDITERKQAEEALLQSEEHLRLIMESATDYAIFTLDMSGKVTSWNNGAEHIFGYLKEDIVGQAYDVFRAKENKSPSIKTKMQIAKEKGRAESEGWYLRKNGNRFWGNGTLMPLLGKGSELQGFLKILTDNSEQRQMEEVLRKAKNEAEKAAKAKEDFLAHMSHEIRTPLSAISGLTSLLLEQKPKRSQLDNLQTLKFSADNLRMLINDILDFSKIQAGKLEEEEHEVNLDLLLQSLQKAHEPRAKEQGNTLEFQVDEKIPEVVYTDQLKLSQILNNLISNAIKFTKKGKIQVEATLNRKKGKKHWIDFSVRDAGVGIPEEKQAKIFEAFTQADNSTVRSYEGTGLGLSITKLLLEHMGSKIKVESKPGEGSHFYFTLPVKEGKATAPPSPETSLSGQAQTRLKQTKLLLVEDMDINRKIIMQFLNDWWQLQPDEARNGQEAIEKAKKNKYDLILMDVRMPKMDGYEAAKKIRSLPGSHYAKIPIIALTADTTQELNKHKEASYFTDVLTKPFESHQLQEKIICYASPTKQGPKKKPAPRQKQAKNNKGTNTHAGKRNEKNNTAFALNTRKLEKFLENDREKIREFLQMSVKNITEFQQSFATAMDEQDAKKLDTLHHKKKMLADMLGLQPLEKLVEQSRTLVQKNTSQTQINKTQQKVETMVTSILNALKARLNEMEK